MQNTTTLHRSLFIGSLSLSLLTGCSDEHLYQLMPSSVTGVEFTNETTETPENNIMNYQYMYNGAGVALGDINQDGLTDIYLVGNSVANKLFLNKGNWQFEDVTDQTKLAGRPDDWDTGVSMVDVNGDGWLDIYLCYSGNVKNEGLKKPVQVDRPERANQLFINNTCAPGAIPTFTESARKYGLDVGNFYPYKVEWGPSDSFYGALLRFEAGQVQAGVPRGAMFDGDIRDVVRVTSKNGSRKIIVSRDNSDVGVYAY